METMSLQSNVKTTAQLLLNMPDEVKDRKGEILRGWING